MYLRPKDSNAMVGVRNRATGKALEGADRQTNRLSMHYSKIFIRLNTVKMTSESETLTCSTLGVWMF